jgi:hypothetical protein
MKYCEIYEILSENLSHPVYSVRLITIETLLLLVDNKIENDVLLNLLNAEQAEITLANYRNRLTALRRNETMLESCGIGSESFTRYLIGSLFINFALVMPETKKFLISNLFRQIEQDKDRTLEYWLKVIEQTLKLGMKYFLLNFR